MKTLVMNQIMKVENLESVFNLSFFNFKKILIVSSGLQISLGILRTLAIFYKLKTFKFVSHFNLLIFTEYV